VVITVFASVATEACVRVVFWVLLKMMMLRLVMCIVWWFNGDLDGHRLFVNDWERNVFFVDDGAVDWNMNWIRHWLLDDIWDLLDDLVGLWNWNLHGYMNLLLNMNWIWSVWEDRINDLNRINWIW
jgi:hypothetical protein